MLLSGALAIGLLLPDISHSHTVVKGKKVVIFFDSDTMTPWKTSFADGMQSYLLNEQIEFPDIRMGYEYLGLDNLPRQQLPQLIIDALELKQTLDPASLIIATLSPIAEATYDFGNGPLSHVPKIYVMTSPAQDRSPPSSTENRWILNGSGYHAFGGMLSIIRELMPERKNLYIIAGASSVDREFVADIGTILEKLSPAFTPKFLLGLEKIELLESVSNLPPDSVIYFLTYQEDKTGAALDQVDIIRHVIRRTNVPVFSQYFLTYVEGVVGSGYADPREIGRTAAKMAVAVLKGEPVKQESNIPFVYRFDQRQLKHWGVAVGNLPSKSIIDNKTQSIFEVYTEEAYVGVSGLVLLAFLAIYLKCRENLISRQRNLFKSVIDNMPDGIFITYENNRVFAANSAAGDMFGYVHDDLVGMPMEAFLGENNEEGSSGYNDQRWQNSLEPRVMTFRKKDGDTFSGEFVTSPVMSGKNKEVGRCCLIRDVSDRLSQEEERRQNQKAEALGQLASGISHDFRNVLGVIEGYMQLVNVIDDEAVSGVHLRRITKAIDHGKELVGEILDFSRNQEPTRSFADLRAVLEGTMKLITMSLPHHIRLDVSLGRDNLSILGVVVQLQQVILNLAINACKAIKEPGGCVSISLSQKVAHNEIRLSHGMLPKGKYAELVISDTGVGMSTEVAAKVFNPFFTTRDSDEGYGLGLTIVYGIVRSHGGYINLETALGKGTRVTVYFELVDNVIGDELSTDNIPPVRRGNGEHVLLVDDESELLE